MKELLLRVKAILDAATAPGNRLHGPSMTPAIPGLLIPENIGMSLSKTPAYPAIEFSYLALPSSIGERKEAGTIELAVYSQVDDFEAISFADQLQYVLSAKELNDPDNHLYVASVQQTGGTGTRAGSQTYTAEVSLNVLFSNTRKV